jgi:hypothetical protein
MDGQRAHHYSEATADERLPMMMAIKHVVKAAPGKLLKDENDGIVDGPLISLLLRAGLSVYQNVSSPIHPS